VVDSFLPRARQLGLELATAAGSDGGLWVEADPDRLGQVVANLVENASSFAEHQIVVGAGTIGGRAVAWVTDDGPGIRPGQLGKVFERHFISDRVSGRRKGSGLGLAIVSELASAMGASVGAQSPVADGQGTTMMVWMRAAARPEAGTPPAPPPAIPLSAVAPPPIELPPVGSPLSGDPSVINPPAGMDPPATVERSTDG